MTDGQRETFAGLADVLIPAAHGMPSAGGVGLAHGPLDRVLRARPDLRAPLAALLDRLANLPPGDAVPGLPQPGLDLLMTVAGGAYTLHPAVRDLMGYHGQAAQILPRAGFGAEALLADALDGPPRWRDPGPA